MVIIYVLIFNILCEHSSSKKCYSSPIWSCVRSFLELLGTALYSCNLWLSCSATTNNLE